MLAKLDGKFMMQELASASRARDYINHLESKVCRESGHVEQILLEENLKKLSEIETSMDPVAESADAFCIFTMPVPNGIQLPAAKACTAGAACDGAAERGGVGAWAGGASCCGGGGGISYSSSS